MRVAFWLLDINYETEGSLPGLWLWGIDDSGRRLLVVDRNFAPYFVVVPEEGANAEAIVEEIKDRQADSVEKAEMVERRFFGKPVKAIKVCCKTVEAVSKSARSLRGFEGVRDCFEDDIRYSLQYLIDNDMAPCSWHDIEAVEEKRIHDVQVDRIYLARSTSRNIERSSPVDLRVLGFSTICYSRQGSPKPDRDPVIIVSVATNDGQEKQFVANSDMDDKPLLRAFIEYVGKLDPDVIVSFDSNVKDWPYLIERCRKLGIHLHVGRTNTEPHKSSHGHVSLEGRVNLDLADYADEFPKVKVKTLANLADYLDVMKLEKRTLIEDVDFADCWDDADKQKALKRFSVENAQCVRGVAEAILDFAVQLSNLVNLPLDQVGTAAVGFRVESFLMKYAHKIGEIVPKRVEQPYRPYVGAVVLSPKPGLHENIAALDFKSMYPNIMIRYNLSPDTYISPKEPESTEIYEAPEVKHKFRKEPPGFYKEILSYLIAIRAGIRSEMKNLDPKDTHYQVLDARQKAVKLITNASYGYAGWTAARWYIKPVAEAATAWGRQAIQNAVKMAEQEGLKVIYGDTDSLFVANETEKIPKLLNEIERNLGLEVEVDKVYVRVFFTEAKKRYAGLLPDGRLDIVGLEVTRGDWAVVAKKVQERVLEIVLRERSPKKAASFVRDFVEEFRQRRLPYRNLVIWKTLTKPAEEYEVKAAHVEAAKMLKEKGWELSTGDKVGYVVVTGSGRLYERVKPYLFASYDEVDLEYYVSKQVIPAALRILEAFGITEGQLQVAERELGETVKLTDFFDG